MSDDPDFPRAQAALADLRGAVDRVDETLLKALGARLATVRVLAQVKRAAGIAPVDPARERVLLASWQRWAEQAGVPGDLAEGILALVLRHTRQLVAETDGTE